MNRLSHKQTPKIQDLDKLRLLLWEKITEMIYETGDIAYEAVKCEANIHFLYGSLVERYKRNQIALHFHLLRSDRSPDTCIMGQCGQVWASSFEPGIHLSAHLTERECTEFGEKQSSVLVDVCEFIQDGETRCAGLPVEVRLKRFDECNGSGIDSSQAVTSLSVLKAVKCETDGEHVLFVGGVVRNQNKFPDQIVERRPQVLKTVPNDQSNFLRNGGFSLDDKGRLILAAVCIGHELALIRVKIPLDLGFNRVQVQFRMADFVPDTFE